MAPSHNLGIWPYFDGEGNLMPPVIALLGTALSALGGGSALAGAATAGGLALGGTELVKSLTSSAPKPSPFPTAQETAANKNQLASIVQQNLGNLQEAGGGGLSPNYDASVIGTETGTGSQSTLLRDLVNQYLSGNSSGGGGSATVSTNFPQLSIPYQSNSSLSGGSGLINPDVFQT